MALMPDMCRRRTRRALNRLLAALTSDESHTLSQRPMAIENFLHVPVPLTARASALGRLTRFVVSDERAYAVADVDELAVYPR
jgi:hypothetical protein